MKILFFSAKDFEKPYLEVANHKVNELVFTRQRLTLSTASKAKGFDAVSIFVTDDASARVVSKLHQAGVKFIAVRAAGFDNIDIHKANELGIVVTHVPKYSPYAVAEHAAALLLALNRKIALADRQVHRQDFTIDHLVGIDLKGKTVGIVGVGNIGGVFAKIMHGFGCKLLGYDMRINRSLVKDYGLKYVSLAELCKRSDIISVHTPLTPETRHLINRSLIEIMKDGVILLNTGRGLCVNTLDVIEGLETRKIGYFGADVYEAEGGVFFLDHSNNRIHDRTLEKLLSFENVIITPHQAFATAEALRAIGRSVCNSLNQWVAGKHVSNQLTHVHSAADPVSYVDSEEA